MRYVELVADGLDTLATIILRNGEGDRAHREYVCRISLPGARLAAGGAQRADHFVREPDGLHQGAPAAAQLCGMERSGRRHFSIFARSRCWFGWDWGPRFATCGIYKNIELQAWDTSRITHVRVQQQHSAGRVLLAVQPQVAQPDASTQVRCRLTLDQQTVVQADGSGMIELAVEQPQLWWPNGLGAQALYVLETELLNGEEICLIGTSKRHWPAHDCARPPCRRVGRKPFSLW